MIVRLIDSIKSLSALLSDNECKVPAGFPDVSRLIMIEQLPEPVEFPTSQLRNPTQMNIATNDDMHDYDV